MPFHSWRETFDRSASVKAMFRFPPAQPVLRACPLATLHTAWDRNKPATIDLLCDGPVRVGNRHGALRRATPSLLGWWEQTCTPASRPDTLVGCSGDDTTLANDFQPGQ